MARFYVEFKVASLNVEDEWTVDDIDNEQQAKDFVANWFINESVEFISVSKIGDCA